MAKVKRLVFVMQRLFIRLMTFGCFYVLSPFLVLKPLKKNKMVVVSYFGKGYGDNGKYICEYLLSTNADIEIVWLCHKEIIRTQADQFPKQIRLVPYKTIRALIELFTAKVWLDNCRKSFFPPKRKGQFYIQTWHAGFGIKQIEHDAEAKLKSRYVKFAKKDSQMCDLLVFESSHVFPDVGYTFWYDGEQFRNGIPRNDILLADHQPLKKKVYEYYQLASTQQLILYAPTFRKDTQTRVDGEFLLKIIETCEKRFGQDYRLLLRLHPNDVEKKADILKNVQSEKIIDASDYHDMQELLCVTDMLITDYSSTIGEMLIMEKKCFIYAYDYDEYMQDRGLIMDLRDLPFAVSVTEQELLADIEHFNEAAYLKELRSFKEKWDVRESGHASQELGDRILQEMKK